MKKIILTLSVILAIFLSFGFIVMQKPADSRVQLEDVTKSDNSGSDNALNVISETNEDQW